MLLNFHYYLWKTLTFFFYYFIFSLKVSGSSDHKRIKNDTIESPDRMHDLYKLQQRSYRSPDVSQVLGSA